jgi:hypothetical protein
MLDLVVRFFPEMNDAERVDWLLEGLSARYSRACHHDDCDEQNRPPIRSKFYRR